MSRGILAESVRRKHPKRKSLRIILKRKQTRGSRATRHATSYDPDELMEPGSKEFNLLTKTLLALANITKNSKSFVDKLKAQGRKWMETAIPSDPEVLAKGYDKTRLGQERRLIHASEYVPKHAINRGAYLVTNKSADGWCLTRIGNDEEYTGENDMNTLKYLRSIKLK